MSLKHIFIIILLSTYSTISHSKPQGHKMSILNKKPFFTLNLKAYGSTYFIRLNGVSVYREYNGDGQISTSLPVNHWMRSGENTLEIIVLPESQGEKLNINANIKIELLVASKDNLEDTMSITTIKFEGKNSEKDYANGSSMSGVYSSIKNMESDPGGDINVSELQLSAITEYKGAIRIKRSLTIPSSLPLWAFFQSDNLPQLEPLTDAEYYAFMDTLFSEYLKIQKALETQTIDNIIDLFSERNNELDAAFYYTPGTMRNKIRSSLIEASKDNEFELSELKRDYLDFTAEDNNKLISLTREGLKSAIVLNFKSGYGSQRYNIIFRRQNGKWIITR